MALSQHKVSFRQENEKKFDKLIKKINKYCKQFELPQVVVEDLGDTNKFFLMDDSRIISSSFDVKEFEGHSRELTLKSVVYKNLNVTIPETIKPHQEWDILGVIDQNEGMVKSAPNKEIPMSILNNVNLTGDFCCDHCNRTIFRNKSVFVRSLETQEIKRVGGTCTKSYLGFDYKNKLELLDYVNEIEEGFESDPDYGYFSNVQPSYLVKEVINTYAYHVTKYGQVSNKQANSYNEEHDENKLSTAHQVSGLINYIYNPPRGRDADYEEAVSEHNKDIAKVDSSVYDEIVEFAANNNDNNFMFNVNNIIKNEVVSSQYMNYLTGACSYYFSVKIREEKERIEKEMKGESKHLGTVGEKMNFKNLKVTNIRHFDSAFGMSTVYNMMDDEGNVVVKFGTINPRYADTDEVEVNSILNFNSDVKDHTDFKGTKQTVIGRLSKLK